MASAASAIEDPSSLPGQAVYSNDGNKIGQINQLYAVGENEEPMWVTVEIETGIGRNSCVFVPLARLKQERDQIRTPYTGQHLLSAPEVEAGEELSEEDDRALRNYYAIDLADMELRTDHDTYAAQVPDAEGAPRQVGDAES